MHASRRTLRSGAVATIAAAAFVLVSFPRVAFAQETCDSDGGVLPPDYGDLVDTFPSDGSTGVPTDGLVRLRYRGHAPLRAFVTVQDVTNRLNVDGTVNVVGTEVIWHSNATLAPSAVFRVLAPDASGGESAFSFTTGRSRSSTQPPGFTGAQTIEAHRAGAADPCGDANASEITISWQRATSNGWPDSEIEYLIYETRGPNISGPVERGRERLQPGASNTCSGGYEFCRTVRLNAANASAPVCFNVQASDPYGQTDGNTHEVCVDPSRGNFFYGCAVGPFVTHGSQTSRPRRAVPLALAGALVATAVVVRRRAKRIRA